MRSQRGLRVSIGLLIGLHALFVFAGPIAPYDPTTQHRDLPWSAPTRVRLIDETGIVRRPFVYASVEGHESPRPYPLRFFVRGSEYRFLGLFRTNRHLVGVDSPARLFLFGSDEYGRDVLSRVLHGGQISLLAGWSAALLSLGLGLALGLAAGFYGGWLDDGVMRLGEVFLALPWLYLLFGVRAVLPLHVEPRDAFLLVVAVVGHPAAHRQFQWDVLRSSAVVGAHADAVTDPVRARLLSRARGRLAEHLTPRLPTLRRSVIHNDANDHNVLVDRDEQRITGIVDFGDMVHSVTANEPAVAAAYGSLGREDSLAVVTAVAVGFQAALPLGTDEKELLFELAIARLATSVALSAHQARLDPTDDYLTISEAPAWATLESMLDVAPSAAAATLVHDLR